MYFSQCGLIECLVGMTMCSGNGRADKSSDVKLTGKEEEEEEEEETAPEKRLRLAKEYLSQLEDEGTYIHLRPVHTHTYIYMYIHCTFLEVSYVR